MSARRLLPAPLAALALAPIAQAAVPPPRAVVLRHPPPATTLDRATFSWRPASLPARCRLDAGRWLACRSPRTYARLRPGRHRFLVRLTSRGRIASFAWTVRRAPVSAPRPLAGASVVDTGAGTSPPGSPATTPAESPAPRRLADHVILVDWDGFAPALLQRGYHTPTLDALAARGSLSLDAQSTFTSFSNPARASMSTGAYPETHGNVAWTWDAATNTVLGQTRELDAESIAQALARDPAGLTEASVQWYMVQDHGVSYGDPSHLYVQPGGNWANRVDTAIKVLEQQPVSSNGQMVTVPRIPDFLAVYSSDPDELEHSEGTNGPDIQAMVEQHDQDLGRLVQATRDVGIYDHTAFVLTADHGMSNWSKTALQTLKDAIAGTGFSYEVLYAGGHAASGTEVIVDPAVRVAYIHLRGEAATDAGRQKVRDALASHPEFTDVLGPSDLAGLHAGPKLGDLVVEAQPPWSFAMNDVSSGEKGAHGSRAELGVPLLLSGAGIGPTPPTSPGLVDVAPTIAALLHAPCPANAQGRALTEAFSGPAACT